MKSSIILFLMIVGFSCLADQTNAIIQFRKPFERKLRIDKENTYQLIVMKETPYVIENNVIIFPGESFGASISTNASGEVALKYESDKSKQDVTFKLEQNIFDDGYPLMILITKNKLKKPLRFQVFKCLLEKGKDKPVYSGEVNASPNIPVYTGIGTIVTTATLYNFEFLKEPRKQQ